MDNNKVSLQHRDKSVESAVRTALNYLSFRSRTVFEMKVYMNRKGLDQDTISQAIAYLKEKDYLNDQRFCLEYIDYHTRYRPKSIYGLQYDLKRKGVSKDIIDQVTEDLDNHVLAAASVKKKINHWQNFDDIAFKKKAMNYLRYRGFDYHTCIETIDKYLESRGKHED